MRTKISKYKPLIASKVASHFLKDYPTTQWFMAKFFEHLGRDCKQIYKTKFKTNQNKKRDAHCLIPKHVSM